ncbi:hypothetical protein AMELA_G00272440 [Ameiurus melas]|uniref:HTH psq-type domain-containing protein n=1 Tax=Ameiurus melas TaxID=219545 RepID=A0A7J5ZLR1_AMEME|nr:hypothetical protein AMELA_G00272440 [Ameiurus melas]
MATRCCSARCSAERKGFRRELDSWRHKLIHCVGFESILEGIYGSRLLQDLSIFDNCEPEATADWSTDVRCSFCNLQLEKISDRLPDSPPHAETPPQGINTSDTLQCQADQFLHAVLHKKEFPESCDPIIPLAAQELMRKMIRQFAVEYAHKIQTVENQNAITQTEPDGPLDLTLSRNTPCAQQDGVLDLSKKNTPSLNTLAQQRLSGRPIRDERLGRSTQFADGLLSKAVKDVRSGALDLHKAAILYGIPQNTLRLHTDHTHSGATPLVLANHNGVTPSRTALHTGETKTATSWTRARSDQPDRGKPSVESAAAASLLHRLVCELRERGDACNTPAGGSALLRIPQVRPGVTTPPSDLSGLVDAVYLNSKTSDRVKILLPKHSDCSSTLESRPLQGDVPPPCVCARSVGGSASADECVEESDRRDKQPRKKRGRYRQYDHDILEEAIAMVMGGKMTVSKAQSVYGVPHSTLEYKVKERMGTLKTPPKKKPRPPEPGTSGTTLNASKRF